MAEDTKTEIAAPVIEAASEIAEVAADAVADANARAEQAEAVADAILDASLESVEEQRRQEFERSIYERLDTLTKGLEACETRIAELTTQNALTDMTADQAAVTAAAAEATAEASLTLAVSNPENVVAEDQPVVETNPETEAMPPSAPALPRREKRRVHLL